MIYKMFREVLLFMIIKAISGFTLIPWMVIWKPYQLPLLKL